MRAVIFDLDNTLLHTDKTVSAYTLGVLDRCRERGIHVLAASARPERTVRQFGLADTFEALVTLNGARVLLPEGEMLNVIPADAGTEVISRLAGDENALISVEMGTGLFASAPIPEWNAAVFRGFPALPGGELYKILARGVTESAVRASLAPGTYFTPIEGGKLYQIMSTSATKWNGVREMLAAFGLTPADAAYFGDDWDDIECVRSCGLGVAVENAIPEVKAAARARAAHCDSDGPARFIEENLLS